MKRKLLSLALSFALCLTLLPGAALAAAGTGGVFLFRHGINAAFKSDSGCIRTAGRTFEADRR